MDRNILRKKLIEFKNREERSISWISRQTGICLGSLHKFASGERAGMSEENLQRLEKFLEAMEGGADEQ